MSRLIIRKVAVLGAGVMGAQIAAHCANAGVPVVLFDLPAKEGDPSGIARKGGASVPSEKRSFSQDRGLAAQAGRKGGEASHGSRGDKPDVEHAHETARLPPI